MAAAVYSRPQVRVFGVWVKGASVHCSARPWLCERRDARCWLPQSRPQWVSPASDSIRGFASAAPKKHLPILAGIADQVLAEELGKAASVLKSEAIPSEEAVQNALGICKELATSLNEPLDSPEALLKPGIGPTSNLLSLEQESAKVSNPPSSKVKPAVNVNVKMADKISMLAYKIVTDPKVFISTKLLSTYVTTQINLGRPQSFPQVFDLYASKPMPQPGTSPIKYRRPNPNRASSAVPFDVANSALDAAIKLKDLALCLSIIQTTVCTTAFKRNKMIRRLLLPATGVALAPVAAYALASQIAQWQQSMEYQSATNKFFAAIIAYVGFTSTLGYVAITTSNDQMDRITWAKGTPLRQRWIREDERALVDRVALAWGFQDHLMRGEEEGVEWEALREWAGRRLMVLDNPDLMEGME